MKTERRPLGLWDLVFYGIVLIQPIAPLPLYGVAQQLSNGHFALIILIAMVAMMITAVSYGRMAALYPAAGSAYTYVGKGLNPHLGFLVGWAMFLDYLLQPLINTVWIAQFLNTRYLSQVPFVVWAGLLAAIFTLLNLLGVRAEALANRAMLAVMTAVVLIFMALAVGYLYAHGGWGSVFSLTPFYNPATFDWKTVWGATSFAALTYVGFDGVTTLAEDTRDPKRTVLIATVLTCAFTGVFGGLEVYLGSLVWPDWHAFHDLTTAFTDIASRVGGVWLFTAMGVILAVAAFGSGLTGGLGAAKLLFGMGRDGVLPKRVFGHITEHHTPTYNIVIIGALTFLGAIALNAWGNAYEHAGELLNFGAFIAFMGVNLAALRHYRSPLALLGFIFCAAIWWNLPGPSKVVGAIWLAAGVICIAIRTRGFRNAPVTIDFSG